ncbi:hypothetical protein [Nocardia puris]|uniref:Uncharacterized protein n=1 Tax=Nocardia puris TaxID=208602 RepID=A0A366CW32_9NOCA|nr:hypothetical protein [Nocardia puris]RBO79947.1 hypothetical protein DFR74_12923 [Nocardia puris]
MHAHSSPDPPATATDTRARVEQARARAEGFVWGALHIQHSRTPEARTATAFAAAYADLVTESLTDDIVVPGLAQAWVAWRTCGNLTADLRPAPSPDQRVPDTAQWDAALGHRTAWWLCAEALGYVRGWCDAAGVGSGDAVDFAHAFAVLVAAGGSRPSIDYAWTNWRSGRPLTAFGG